MSPSPRLSGLSRREVLLYSMIGVPIGMTINALLFLMPAFYAKYTAVSLTSIASALVIARSVEIVSDPLIGYLSDRTNSRWGPRKPWILAGALIAPFAAYFLYHPSPTTGWLYFLAWSGLTYFSWGLVNITTLAWGTELGRSYSDRTLLFTGFGMAAALGTVLFAVIQVAPALGNGATSPSTVSAIGWTIAAVFPLMVLPALVFLREGHKEDQEHPSVLATLRSVRANGPLWRLVGCYSLGGLAAGMIVSCWFFYTDTYLSAGQYFAYTLLAFYLGNALALPVWQRVMLAIGKHRAWAIGWGTSALVALCLPHVPVGPDTKVWLIGLFAAFGLTAGVELAAPAAILADVVDYDHWKSGTNKAGNYNAFIVITQKAAIAIGSAIGYLLLDFFGYDIKGGQNGSAATSGFLLTLVYVPCGLYLLASIFMWNFPIDRRRHGAIRRRIDARIRRSA